MGGPGDEMAAGAGDHGHLRASHADREQVIGALKAAFVAGMLAKDELDLRVGQAVASRTYAELAALTADLPAGLPTAQPPNLVQTQRKARVLRPGPVIAVATAAYAGVWAYVIVLSPHGGDNPTTPGLIGVGGYIWFVVLGICVARMVALRREKRSSGQLPRRPAPGPGLPASQRPPSAGPGGQLPPGDHGRPHTAEAARRRLPRPPLPSLWPSHRGHPVGRRYAIGHPGH
jgi:Domain of unknown function (DUF1707)